MKGFQIKSWHFVIAIGLFYILTVIVADIQLKHLPMAAEGTRLNHVEKMEFEAGKLIFLFFYDSQSELSQKMRYNVEKLLEEDLEHDLFYAVDVQKHPQLYYEHNVSGVPNILVFKEDKEIRRVMGLVSYKNLSTIVRKLQAKE